jgi:hypothetical protein
VRAPRGVARAGGAGGRGGGVCYRRARARQRGEVVGGDLGNGRRFVVAVAWRGRRRRKVGCELAVGVAVRVGFASSARVWCAELAGRHRRAAVLGKYDAGGSTVHVHGDRDWFAASN